ncbi:hypothetical protein [Paracidovorax cattleyae]|uniref:Membrane protein involved in the export of O-antigen and teichoic acid n=1 Tax=Paracidovorax cattleyae TaxID=80868 RepID=A0A1H0KEG7_9BURK|nr:hypothetical protein [Paracidovorax cattleyae]AVS73526.1 hypothetical protein C8240_05190 [Paracidovorax cattleyae]SDO54210.1 hypothetical protein SAMN04489708_101194 [Paracidovorax cattleyae]
MKLLGTTTHIAAASAVSLGAQGLFGLLMLRLFQPQEVGRFTVVSQIGFFWMTLALAQSQLRFLANIHHPPGLALRQAMRASLLRWTFLLPIAAAAVWIADLGRPGACLAWAALLALLQLGWYMAQPWALRTASAQSAALARSVPPLAALAAAGSAGMLLPGTGATVLFAAAAGSYAIGALWLLRPARDARTPPEDDHHTPGEARPLQQDDRGPLLRIAHTAADAAAGMAVLVMWQRFHGAAEASYLAVLLRLLGLLPAVVHAAWPQVLLSQGREHSALSRRIGLSGAACTLLAGLAAAWALHARWIPSAWQGLEGYLAPLVIWQGCACLFAAYGHLPFQRGLARPFSRAAIGFNGLQIAILCLPLAWPGIDPVVHMWTLAGTSAAILLVMVRWLTGKKLK